MIGFLRRNRQPLIVSLVLVFVISIFVGLGGGYLTDLDVSEAVAVVDGKKIQYIRFRVRVDQYLEALRERDEEVTREKENNIKGEMLREMIVEEILAAQAEKMGLHVSDFELATSIEQTPAFQQNGRFIWELYKRAVRFQFRTTIARFEEERRRSMMSVKLKTLMFRTSKVSPTELRGEYEAYMRSLKPEQKKDAMDVRKFAANLRQSRAVDTINYHLKQTASQANIRSYLEQRERGM